MVDIIILKVLLTIVFIVVVGCIFAVSQLSNETKILIMTKSEKILRLSITKFDWSNDDKHTQMIPYDDALKAVEEALAEEPNRKVSNLTDISKWDFSDWDFSNCLGDRINFNNFSNDKVFDYSKIFANSKHYSKEDADKVKDLISDLKALKTKYTFKSKTNQKMFVSVCDYLDKLLNFISK